MPRRNDSRSTFLTLDRIEEGIAVTITDDGSRVLMPASLLPGGTAEGTVLEMRLKADPEETERRTARVREMQRRLVDRNG